MVRSRYQRLAESIAPGVEGYPSCLRWGYVIRDQEDGGVDIQRLRVVGIGTMPNPDRPGEALSTILLNTDYLEEPQDLMEAFWQDYGEEDYSWAEFIEMAFEGDLVPLDEEYSHPDDISPSPARFC